MTELALETWFKDLTQKIGMKICIEPKAKYVNVEGNRGVTGLVGIETSHSSVHVWDECKPALLQMDVYSCAAFELETIVKKLAEFGLVRYKYMVIDRGADDLSRSADEEDADFEIHEGGKWPVD